MIYANEGLDVLLLVVVIDTCSSPIVAPDALRLGSIVVTRVKKPTLIPPVFGAAL